MKTSIIAIGNSRGIRIPKVLLEESGLSGLVEISLTNDGLAITSADPHKQHGDELLSEEALAKDWNNPDEEDAWANL